MKCNAIVVLGIAVGMLGIGNAFAGGETLRTGDAQRMDKWYGRAGGLVGADRIEAIGKATYDRVGISYDQDVAKRTNMSREGAGKNEVGITYDKDVAKRTNMPRDVPPVQDAGTAAAPHN
jgi:hypothetical protein